MSARGFSLIELLFTLFFLSLFAAAVLPKTDVSERMTLEMEALQLVSDLRQMQQHSMNLAVGQAAVTTLKGDVLPKMRFMSGAKSSYAIVLSTKILRRHIFHRNVYLLGGNALISFNCDGYPNQPTTIVLRCRQQERTVVIDRVGRIRMQ